MSGMKQFELWVVLRVRQRGASEEDAADRVQITLTDHLQGRLLPTEEHQKYGHWEPALYAEVARHPTTRDRVQVLVVKELPDVIVTGPELTASGDPGASDDFGVHR
jgi:hypothetical protein